MFLRVAQAAEMLGVTERTVRRWALSGKIRSLTTIGGQHRFDADYINSLVAQKTNYINSQSLTARNLRLSNVAIYARVSSNKQVKDLKRQQQLLISFCKANKYNIVLSCVEVSTSFNHDRPELFKIIEAACNGRIKKIIVEHRDKLCGVGFPVINRFLNNVGCEVEAIRHMRDNDDYADLVNDAVFIIANISTRRFMK